MNRRKLLQGAGAMLSACGATPLCASPLVSPLMGRAPGRTIGIDLLRQPDAGRVFLGDAIDTVHALDRSSDRWSAAGVDLMYALDGQGGAITVHAPRVALRRIHLRWRGVLSKDLLVAGDAWERSYGDLAWLGMLPERHLPWYCLLHDGAATSGFGVAVGAAALAFWQVDPSGVSLWLDMRNGGNGVLLGQRSLPTATVVTYTSQAGENAYSTTQQLCRKMAPKVTSPRKRGENAVKGLFGSNDWYYAYGTNTPDGILRDADLVRELSPAGPARPFTIIDAGYGDRKLFPDMHKLADSIRSRKVSPGIWIRPLLPPTPAKASWLLPAARFGRHGERVVDVAFDPTVPEGMEGAMNVVREAKEWGYELLKHDFSTYDLLGQWGFEMGASPSIDGWSFQDRSKTNAEIITMLYRGIRSAAGEDCLVIGCNTVGHLSASIFDAQRTGDDVSGLDWERTRRMGVNTLAFRLPQNGVFYAADPDCIPITRRIPWSLTEQWLRAVAASGSVLLISPEPEAIGKEQKDAIREAFRVCASMNQPDEPIDWLTTRTPGEWAAGKDNRRYTWLAPEGASPFPLVG